METLIVICLLVVIVLLLHDKIVIKGASKKDRLLENKIPDLPEIMGLPKLRERLIVPNKATGSQKIKPTKQEDSFDAETEGNGFDIRIPQEELDEVFGGEPDFDQEEEEWRRYREPNGEDGFATGVTFDELSTVGALLQQEALEPALQEQAVEIVHKIQGTELFSLLENSIEDASQKIARLLDKTIETETDSGSSTMRNKGLDGFDIGEFV
ncbi:conjugal transfer protein TraD [Agriterribacter sp.]|jgi:hypothetical protein|uniref:conjugal transfer protein TraD n=1 Tax=Agriterribacter sp. TaxID=2821509 RepID=UPI002CF95465|nr:conjugal transfer protein TraD [Agriterribacter sp.]HRO46775.1 conjugal transfer protein TraD [Agriterribacter sp.]